MNNYKPKYCVGTAYHALNKQTDQGNDWGKWDPEKFTVEDCAFGFVVMENGATITLESSWAINMLDTREAITTICGTNAGADMLDGLRINGIRQNLKYTFKPDMSAKGAAFYDGHGSESPADREAAEGVGEHREEAEHPPPALDLPFPVVPKVGQYDDQRAREDRGVDDDGGCSHDGPLLPAMRRVWRHTSLL